MPTGPQQVWLPVSGTLRGGGEEYKGTGHKRKAVTAEVEGVRVSSQVRERGCSAFLFQQQILCKSCCRDSQTKLS